MMAKVIDLDSSLKGARRLLKFGSAERTLSYDPPTRVDPSRREEKKRKRRERERERYGRG